MNVTQPLALAAALGGVALMVVSSLAIQWKRPLPPALRLAIGRLQMFEVAPALFLGYLYLRWHEATGRSVSTADVLLVVGVLWTAFNYFKFSRNLGEERRERIYLLDWYAVRWILEIHLALLLALNVALYATADLSGIYLAFALLLIAAFAVLSHPVRREEKAKPWWVGLPLPTAMILGLLVQLLVYA